MEKHIMTKPELEIIGTDGNAFALIGKAQNKLKQHLRDEGKSHDEIKKTVDAMTKEMTSGDYDHLLGTLGKYFDLC